MSTPQAIRGTQDIFGAEAEAFAHVVETFERVRKLYRFRRIEMPVFEKTEVFSRSIGETTDVVSKEMYSFKDRGGESLTLRPEFTAGIARAYISNGWKRFAEGDDPLRLATHGPLFRYERPQKGRYRQFHQIDAEIIGAPEPQADVELLAMADQLLRQLRISDVSLHLNTLGDADTRSDWQNALFRYFSNYRGDLSEDSQNRLLHNPLRILDSKDEGDIEIVAEAPAIDNFMTSTAGNFFESVETGLTALDIRYVRDRKLVRGLDYYRHTAFEFIPNPNSHTASKLGSQSTLLGGGRYDGLIENLGGQSTPAVGWAAGIERLSMLLEGIGERQQFAAFVLESDQPSDANIARLFIKAMRNSKVPTLSFDKGSIRKRFDKAIKASPSIIFVLKPSQSEGEVANLDVRVSDWKTGSLNQGMLGAPLTLAKNLFLVDRDHWKYCIRHGGRIILFQK